MDDALLLQVAVYDLADALCLAEGLTPAALPADPTPRATTPATAVSKSAAAAKQRLTSLGAKMSQKLTREDSSASPADNSKAPDVVKKDSPTVGFVPPRREIGE